MIKMAVFDMDGTLLDDQHEISEANRLALLELRERGCLIVLATGRPKPLLREYIEKLKVCDYVISCNGAILEEIATGKKLIDAVIDKAALEEVIRIARNNNSIYMCYNNESIFTEENYRVKYFMERNKRLPESLQMSFIMNPEMETIMAYDMNKVLIIEKDKEKYKQLFETLRMNKMLYVTESSPGFIDVMDQSVNKMKTLRYLAESLDIKPSEIMAFGDNYNDLEMLEYAGIAVTTDNAVEDVKKRAAYVSCSNNESGVAAAIMKFIDEQMFI